MFKLDLTRVGSAKVSVLTAATHRLADTNLEARLGGFVLPSPLSLVSLGLRLKVK